MKGIDTNVLVRILVADDADQADRARLYVAENAPCWINRVVLCETVWVLERLYGLGRARISAALRQLLNTKQFEFEDVEAVQAGIAAIDEGFDFAAAVILATNKAHGCTATATFDRKALQLDGFEGL